jgi:deoxyribonuclease V
MSIDALHPWTLDPDEAIQLQVSLRQRLVLTWDDRKVKIIGGIDICYAVETVRAAISVFRYPQLTPLVAESGEAPLSFPYTPGLLVYQVVPAILAAWEKLLPEPIRAAHKVCSSTHLPLNAYYQNV